MKTICEETCKGDVVQDTLPAVDVKIILQDSLSKRVYSDVRKVWAFHQEGSQTLTNGNQNTTRYNNKEQHSNKRKTKKTKKNGQNKVNNKMKKRQELQP